MPTETQARLTPEQVQFYKREGYLKIEEPVFPEAKFNALKDHFEDKLARLPGDVRPEGMDCPHFVDIKLFDWLMSDEVLDLVEPLIGPDIALFASHFICKPKGNGKRVPWHEDSAYWGTTFTPMEVATVWLAIDHSTRDNGCLSIIPRTHNHGYSEYEPVDANTHVFGSEVKRHQFDKNTAVALELKPNQASIHHAKMIHGSEANTSNMRRCGYTMRYVSTRCKFKSNFNMHIYLARGRDHAGNTYGDPTKTYEDLRRYRELHVKHGH
jgi:chlorinating enzyme